MAWDPIDETELRPGFSILKHIRQVWNCAKFLYGQIGTMGASSVLNGSFEVDSDGNGQPDNWTLNTYPGGSGAVVTDVPAHGKNAVKLVHPGGAGNGGGYYESDYVTCSGLHKIYLGFIHWATAAGMHNQVVVRWYDKGKVFVSSAALYDSTNNPTSSTYFVTAIQPPAGARFYKLQLAGGVADTNISGTAYFDGVGPAGLEIFTTMSASATIPAASHTNGNNWTDIGSMAFRVPFPGVPVKISFTAEASDENGGDQLTYIRFRVGTAYSNEGDSGGATEPVFGPAQTFTIDVPAVDRSGIVTVYMQTKNYTGVHAWGRKSASAITVKTAIVP